MQSKNREEDLVFWEFEIQMFGAFGVVKYLRVFSG